MVGWREGNSWGVSNSSDLARSRSVSSSETSHGPVEGASQQDGARLSRDVWIALVQIVLIVNAVPAFVVLSLAPGKTVDLFVWTVRPEASAQLLAAMYGNAALLTVLTLGRKAWGQIRVAFVVFVIFAVAATIVTFFHLDPFLAHPRYFFVYWLVNYVFLFLVTPYVFVREERRHGGRLPVERALLGKVRVAGFAAMAACVAVGTVMLVGPTIVDDLWPWPMTPLVARIIGVWMTALGAAFAWALWDGDRARASPIFDQALPTAFLVGIVPLLHRTEMAADAPKYLLFSVLVGSLAFAGANALWQERRRIE